MTLLPSRPGSKAAEMTNEKIPEPGPARDRMVAEVVGWTWHEDEGFGWCFDAVGAMRHPSEYDADALAVLEAWRLADPSRRSYAIDSPDRSPDDREDCPDFTVVLYPGAHTASAPTLPAAATAALLATREGT